jgi:hypothetical protein
MSASGIGAGDSVIFRISNFGIRIAEWKGSSVDEEVISCFRIALMNDRGGA